MILALWTAAALAGPVRFDRVDLVAEDPGTWLNQDLPAAGVNPLPAAVRFVTQVKVVLAMPVDGLYVGASISSWSLTWEQRLVRGRDDAEGLFVAGTLQTSLGLPRGLVASAVGRIGPARLALGASLLSSATWAEPDWSHWQLMPTIGLGIVLKPRRGDPTARY